MELAISERDFSTANFLQWFIGEQVEEVASMDQLLKVVERAGEGGLLLVEDYIARGGNVAAPKPTEV